jgi:hypothetical protein
MTSLYRSVASEHSPADSLSMAARLQNQNR